MAQISMHYVKNNEQIQLYASNCSFWVPFFLADKIALGQTLENFQDEFQSSLFYFRRCGHLRSLLSQSKSESIHASRD